MNTTYPQTQSPFRGRKELISARQTLLRNPLAGQTPSEDWGFTFAEHRQAAIDAGSLVDLTVGPFKAACRRHYTLPVAITAAAWDLVRRAVKSPKGTGDLAGALEHLLLQSKRGTMMDLRNRSFCAFIKGAEPRTLVTFKAVTGRGDFGEPVITLMLPLEK